MSRIYHCYVVYRKGSIHDVIKGRKRQGPDVFLTMPSRDAAVEYMENNKIKHRPGEYVDKIVASAWKDDKALRAMGAIELPLEFPDSD